jgi:hypothetical protein
LGYPDSRQRETLQGLTKVLAAQPEMRVGLDDDARARQLVADIEASWIGAPIRLGVPGP